MQTDSPAPAERIERFNGAFSSATEQCVTQAHRPAPNKALDPACWGVGGTVCRRETCASPAPSPPLSPPASWCSSPSPYEGPQGDVVSLIHFQERQFCPKTSPLHVVHDSPAGRRILGPCGLWRALPALEARPHAAPPPTTAFTAGLWARVRQPGENCL